MRTTAATVAIAAASLLTQPVLPGREGQVTKQLGAKHPTTYHEPKTHARARNKASRKARTRNRK